MRKIVLILNFIFLSFNLFAQESAIEYKTIKVKPVKPTSNLNVCSENGYEEIAIVMEYDVVEKQDQESYGNKIYVIVPCYDYQTIYDRDLNWDLKFSESKFYIRDFLILNEDLLEKNTNKKRYWTGGLSRKTYLYHLHKE